MNLSPGAAGRRILQIENPLVGGSIPPLATINIILGAGAKCRAMRRTGA